MDVAVALAQERRRRQGLYPRDRDARISSHRVLAKTNKRRNVLVARFGTDGKHVSVPETPQPVSKAMIAHLDEDSSDEKVRELLKLGDETHLPPSKVKKGLVEYRDLKAFREPRASKRASQRLSQEAIDAQRKAFQEETGEEAKVEEAKGAVTGKAPPPAPVPSLLSFVMQKPRSDLRVLADRAAADQAAAEQAAADKAAAAQAAATVLQKTTSYYNCLDDMSAKAQWRMEDAGACACARKGSVENARCS